MDDLLLNTIGGLPGILFCPCERRLGEIQWNESEIKYRISKSRLQRIVLWRQGSQRRTCLYAAAISFSYYTQGNAPLAAAALGFCSIIIAVSSVVYGVFAMMEKEKNYLLAKISLAAAGILLLVWVLMIVFAL